MNDPPSDGLSDHVRELWKSIGMDPFLSSGALEDEACNSVPLDPVSRDENVPVRNSEPSPLLPSLGFQLPNFFTLPDLDLDGTEKLLVQVLKFPAVVARELKGRSKPTSFSRCFEMAYAYRPMWDDKNTK